MAYTLEQIKAALNKSLRLYPIAGKEQQAIKDSFGRQYVPGTTRLYERARTGSCKADPRFKNPGHCATDIGKGRKGARIVATADGHIELKSFGKSFGGPGHEVTLVPAGTVHGVYSAHCDRVVVRQGQKVRKGQTIAYVGAHGQVSGPHDHFEFRMKWNDWNTAVDSYARLIALYRAGRIVK